MSRTSLVRIAAPEALPVTQAMVWDHLRLILENDQPADKSLVDELVAAAVDRLDGASGLLNRALITQRWQATFDAFGSGLIVPLARCQSVDSVAYLDGAGATVALAVDQYRLSGHLTDRCTVLPARGASWPSTYSDPEAVTLTFTAGFGDDPEDIPATIRLAILEMVTTSYINRGSLPNGGLVEGLPGSAQRTVVDWVVWPAE